MQQVRNFILAEHGSPWEISDVSSIDDLKGRALYDALMRLRPEGLAETDWAVKAGMNRGFFTSLKKAPTSPRIVTIRKLLRHVDKTENDLYAAASGQAVILDREPDQLPTRSEGAGDTVSILRLDLSLPMGPGAVVDDYVEEEPLEFDQAYINSFTRTPAHRLRLAAGAGDSMFPTLVPNDLVWIDTTQNQLLHADRIYAASINGGAAIKRLRPIAGGRRILVVSDNKTVDAYEVDAEEVVIWGRVIRFARDL